MSLKYRWSAFNNHQLLKVPDFLILKHYENIFFSASQPTVGLYSQPFSGLLASSFEVSRSHTTTRQSRQDSSGRVISSSQRPLPDNTQHSQQTNVHAPSGIRAHNLNRCGAVDLRFRPRGYWDRL